MSTTQSHDGFTLSKALIAVSILGIVATLAIPKVLDYKTEQDNKTRFLQTYAALSGMYKALAANKNPVTSQQMRDYMTQTLTPVKWCENRVIANGCWTDDMAKPSDVINQVGFILPNGVYATDFNYVPSNDGFYLDLNGPEPPNVLGQDTLALAVCVKDGDAAGCHARSWASAGYTGDTGPGAIYPTGDATFELWKKWLKH